MRIAKKYLPPFAVLLISTLGVAYAATNLFTQTFPAIPAVPGTTSNCTTLTSNVASAATGSSGVVLFDCSGTSPFGTTRAFSVNTPGGTIAITPTFTLPAPYTGTIGLVGGSGTLLSGCTADTGLGGVSASITSGSAFTTGTAKWFYCLQYTNAASTGLPTFSIAWTTPTTPFTQAFPTIPGVAGIKSNCATLTPFDPTLGPNHVTSIAIGSSGLLNFDCSGTSSFGTTLAFSVSAPGASATFTPQFTLTSPYVAVAITSSSALGCQASVFPSQQLTSGTAHTFSGSDSFDYCLQFQNVPSTGLPTFNITWTT